MKIYALVLTVLLAGCAGWIHKERPSGSGGYAILYTNHPTKPGEYTAVGFHSIETMFPFGNIHEAEDIELGKSEPEVFYLKRGKYHIKYYCADSAVRIPPPSKIVELKKARKYFAYCATDYKLAIEELN